ncbi:toprim domain-containing protein [Bacteroides sp.]|uniref:toprim domain-containing protein n=1 Tax=Bacteroides sp. TaxID=29523 RepID=UPI003AB334BB
MNIQEVKNIRIADYLQSLGYSPVKQQGNSLWYKSPLREEKDASFKVNTELNKWYDFGLGKGGNIIALAEELYATDYVPYLLNKIAERVPHIRPISFSFRQQPSEPSFQYLEVGELTHPALLGYLQERRINTDLARLECKELHFIHNGKPYFAIGFPNVAGGYEVRNRFFKGCIAPKGISHIRQQGEPRGKCLVFEGMTDYLSFLTLRMKNCPSMPNLDGQDYIILNSVANVSKAMDVLHGYERIHCLLDNDEVGRNAYLELAREFSGRIRDFSDNYNGHKDLNDYLCGKHMSQSAEPIKERKQLQSARRMIQPPKKKGLKM